jgi:4'-phosphopantetheinyl transferase EntD
VIWLGAEGPLDGLAPRGFDHPLTAVAVAGHDELEDDLFPDEAAAVAQAVAVRRREFASARALARNAMRAVGLAAGPLPRNPDRSPAWPDGVAGSISHCRHLAAVAVSRDLPSIGVDVECTHRLRPGTLPAILTAAELARAPVEPEATALFSAKEAIFKAIYPVTGRRAEFHDAELDLDLAAGRFSVSYRGREPANRLMERLTGAVGLAGGHVLTLAWLERL